jgi:glycosyltransferase involved in cell wall biosynthesis
MRILLVSGVAVGGAARSTYELARVLGARGHTVGLVVRNEDAPRRTEFHRRLVNARVKTAGRPGNLLVDRATRLVGRRLEPGPPTENVRSWTAVRPENALPRALAAVQPEIVVVNSIDLPAWRQLRADLAERNIPVALYLREENGLLHLSHSKIPPDVLFANAEGHAAAAAKLGYDAVVVPSIIDCATCSVESTRERVLFVNPVPMYGLDIALEMARSRPEIPFAFVESWPLSDGDLHALEQQLAELPNVELRRFVDSPRALYRDARILLVPYRYPGRSRVVSEAHCSSIPVLASNLYGISEAVGGGGVLVDPDGPVSAWIDALDRMWPDGEAYDALVAAAHAASARPEIQPDSILGNFEATLDRAVREFGRGA